MKNFKYLILTAIVVALFSCSGDRPNDGLGVESILGVWRLTASSQNGMPKELSECDLSDLLIFDEKKLMYVFNKNGSGNKCAIQTLKKDYTISNNIITEGDGKEITIQQIYTFEPSSLILEFSETHEDEVIVYKETYVKKQF